MNIKHLLNLLFRRGQFQKPARISRENVKGFIQGNLRALRHRVDFLKPSRHIEEQAYWRLAQVSHHSPECYVKEQCKVCGCSVHEIVFEDRGCHGGCYPPMMSQDVWNKFKIDNHIQIEPQP